MATKAAARCRHPELTKIIDKLGPMLDVGHTGQARAKVLESHYECATCGATIDPKEISHG